MPLADLSFETVGPVVVAHLAGEIDMSNAGELGEAVGRQVSGEALGLVLDLGAVDYLDSAAIRVVYELRERLRTRGQQLRLVVAADAPIADALRLADVQHVVGASETLDGAILSIAP
jgi:anti-sigma B factor antagonist